MSPRQGGTLRGWIGNYLAGGERAPCHRSRRHTSPHRCQHVQSKNPQLRQLSQSSGVNHSKWHTTVGLRRLDAKNALSVLDINDQYCEDHHSSNMHGGKFAGQDWCGGDGRPKKGACSCSAIKWTKYVPAVNMTNIRTLSS